MSDIISNLVAYWPLKTDQNDYSGNNYHGSNNGQIFENNCQKFNNNYIDMGDILNSELQSTNFTISQNFYQEQHEDSSGYNGFIIQKWNSSTYEDNSFILSPIRVSFNNPGSIYYPETYKLFKWYHYSFTYDNGTVKMYINGNLVQTHNNVILGDSTGKPLRIGNLWNDQYNFIGRINNVRIYNRTLSEIDMSDLYDNDRYDINNIQMDSSKNYNIIYNNLTEPTHHILFKDYDGTVITGNYISDGGTQTPPPDPTRDGYIFSGWDNPLTNITNPTIFTAQYSLPEFIVTFKDYDGTTFDTQTVTEGNAQTQPQNPSREGYTFSGWDKPFNNITSDLTVNQTYASLNNRTIEILMNKTKIVTAVMERTIFNVIFKDYDGTILKEESVNINNAQTQPQNPSREGYTFSGWDKDFSNITSDLIVTQTYDINTYTVNITINGNGSISGNGTYNHGDSVTITQTPNTGYHFVNWTGDIQNNNPINTFTITEDKNVTQNFQINTYTVNITNDGNGNVNKTPDKTIYEHNEVLQIEQIPNQNYEFDNWSGDLNTSNQTETLTITSDLNIQQNFKIIQKEIKVIIEPPNGGTVNEQGIYDYNSEFTLEQTPNDGYRFVGWKEGSCED